MHEYLQEESSFDVAESGLWNKYNINKLIFRYRT